MGRIAAYLGPQTPAAALVEGGPHALVRQAAAHPFGFGLAWYPPDGDPEPVRLTSRQPLWAERQLLAVPRRYGASCAVAAVGSADRPVELADLQPFQHGSLLFAHEGGLERFEEVFARPLRERLSERTYALVRGSTASELLFATWLDALGSGEGHDAMASALEVVVEAVHRIGAEKGAAGSFAILATDGRGLVTLRTAFGGPAPELYTLVAEPGSPLPATGRVVASEPLFPGSWTALEANSLVIFTPDEVPDDQATIPGGAPILL